MARPLRIKVAGGWYHVTARGQWRERIFGAKADYRRFLKLVAEMRERYRVRVRAYCLMPIKGEKWELFRDRHNDWGRDLALWGGRLYGGLTLAELGREAGGLDYATVAVATARLVKTAKKDRVLRKAMATLKAKCEK